MLQSSFVVNEQSVYVAKDIMLVIGFWYHAINLVHVISVSCILRAE